jgi:U3 small nucleolar RNA-associated protein 25
MPASRAPGSFKKGKRPRKGPKFSQSRLRDEEDEVEEQDQAESEEEDVHVTSESESEDESAKVRPYNVLLEAFNVKIDQNEHRRKRRKVKHPSQAEITFDEEDGDDLSESTGDEIESESDMNDLEEVDVAEEPEEVDSDDEKPNGDYFTQHFEDSEIRDLESPIGHINKKEWQQQKLNSRSTGKCVASVPQDSTLERPTVQDNLVAWASSQLKSRLKDKSKALESLDNTGKTLLPYLFSYHDLLFSGRTPQSGAKFGQLIALHALNHVLKTRSRIIKHNAVLSSQKQEDGSAYRDQGFTRPKVLYILPTRNSCSQVVKSIISLFGPEQAENTKRFNDEFSKSDSKVADDRPDDYKELFAGNDDDMFRIGIKLTRKTIKLFSKFYGSDIILASPLGLRRAIEAGNKKKQDYDFLSSIEIVVLDQTDALLMQNWDHVKFVMAHLNLSPTETHDTDFSRVRRWCLDDQAKYLRQTIILSAYLTPEINALYNNDMQNVAGKIKYQPFHDGSLLATGYHIRQSFSRFPSPSLQKDPEARFAYFTSTVLPWILRLPRPVDGAPGVLIFIPSYFDFVRIRNYFSTSNAASSISFGTLSENNTPAEPDVRRARSHFLNGKHSVMLYSGRAHHFYRYMIKGVKNVVIYQLPSNPLFYREVVAGFIGNTITSGRMAAEESKVKVLFSKWDVLSLERVVGTERVPSMLGGRGDTFDFV